MAKIIRHNGEFSHYEPGIIYDIGVIDPQTNTRIPFYVGETCDPEGRLLAHKRAGRNADDSSTLVYQYIKLLDENNLIWTMETLAKFEQEGPTDLEDEWIMRYLYDGCQLKNMKKGNANWMAEREAAASDMRKRGINSFRKYKEVLSVEEKQAEADRKHAEWLQYQAEQVAQQAAQAKVAQARQAIEVQQAADRAKVRKMTDEAYAALERQKQQRQDQARIRREEIEAAMAEQRTEQIRKDEIRNKQQADLISAREAQYEADKPAREARLKANAEAQAILEIERQAAKLEVEQKRVAQQHQKDVAPIEDNIKTLQIMIHLYNQFGCSDAVLQTANERLTELIEMTK